MTLNLRKEESMSGTNPKVRVEDARGVEWTVKFGSEVNAETFATRIVWAAGYFVEPDYFVPSGKIENVGPLTRAKKFIQPDGGFSAARFEMRREKGVKKLDEEQSWSWMENPFVGTKELNGLKVVMMLVSNFDNKDVRDVSDVNWLMQYLGRVTDDQLRAGLQASGATPEEVTCFTQSLRDRINQLLSLAR